MTMVRLNIHPEQVRHHAQAAINGFSTLNTEDAIENALSELRTILIYIDALDATQYAVFEGISVPIEFSSQAK